MLLFLLRSGGHRVLPSFPTRRSSDLDDAVAGEMYLPGLTIKFSKTPGKLGPVPTPGQHTDEILGGLPGYDEARMSELRGARRSEEHTSELQSHSDLVCRLLLEKKNQS